MVLFDEILPSHLGFVIFHGARVKIRVLKIGRPSVVPSVDPSVEGFILIMNSNFASDNSIRTSMSSKARNIIRITLQKQQKWLFEGIC